MAAVLRSTISRIAPAANLLSKQLPCIQQVAGISSKTWRDLIGIKRPPPYDYKKKTYTFTKAIFDKTTHRLDENSKVILVEGPIAAGKTEFAKELAKELDMLYVPRATMDYIYINSYGFDLRQLDPKLPPHIRSFDTNNFLRNPHDLNVASYQLHMYKLKYIFYIDALAHLFSTGQGVVLERSAYSDIVFVEALYRHNLISKLAHKAIHEVRDNTLQELLKPHLVIYLDVPVDVVQQRIKERNNPAEVNSELFKDNKYLQTIDNIYKQDFLKKINTHAELLVYDWSNGGDVELVVEDIERINFDGFESEDTKMADWRFMPREWDWCEARIKYTGDAFQILTLLEVPLTYCDELQIEPEDDKLLVEVYESAPGMQYAYGYNKSMGDKGILFKNKIVRNENNSLN